MATLSFEQASCSNFASRQFSAIPCPGSSSFAKAALALVIMKSPMTLSQAAYAKQYEFFVETHPPNFASFSKQQ